MANQEPPKLQGKALTLEELAQLGIVRVKDVREAIALSDSGLKKYLEAEKE